MDKIQVRRAGVKSLWSFITENFLVKLKSLQRDIRERSKVSEMFQHESINSDVQK